MTKSKRGRDESSGSSTKPERRGEVTLPREPDHRTTGKVGGATDRHERHSAVLDELVREGQTLTLEFFQQAAANENRELCMKYAILALLGRDMVRRVIATYDRHLRDRTEGARSMPGDHPRNTTAMQISPRCGARTRSAALCRSPAVSGKKRCRMHGGKRSGAPRENTNALKHGLYAAPVLVYEKRLREFWRLASEAFQDDLDA